MIQTCVFISIIDGVTTCNNDTYYKIIISKVRGSNVNLDCNEENRMSGRRDNNVKKLMEDDSPDLDLESGDGSGHFEGSLINIDSMYLSLPAIKCVYILNVKCVTL